MLRRITGLGIIAFCISVQHAYTRDVKMDGDTIKSKTATDTVYQKTPNAVIQTKVNNDGVIEITKKEFDKIPAERQELIKKDTHYKIIEDPKP